NLAAGRAVEDRIGDHRHRLDGRMQRQEIAFLAAAAKAVGSGVTPHVAAVAPKTAELNVIAMPVAAVFENEDELVLAPIKRTHRGTALDPDNQVFQLAIGLAAGGQQLLEVAPVHAEVVQRAVEAECGEVAASLAEKGGEFGAAHLA